jgi:hypothetical protein
LKGYLDFFIYFIIIIILCLKMENKIVTKQ